MADTRKNIEIKKNYVKSENSFINNVLTYSNSLDISELAKIIKKTNNDIIKFFFLKGRMYNLNSTLSDEEITEYCFENNIDVKKNVEINRGNILDYLSNSTDDKDLKKRPPIITVMGHVDHGKTTLLDYIRKTNVWKSEVGGITQKIGAYQIEHNKNKITFIDTPGHEAFSNMRQRSANITDIIVLVVAGDDGVNKQTQEAIKHAKAAKVPIIIFINKMDKPGINVENVLKQLSDNDLLCEEWGGEHITIKGSAITGQGVNELLDAIILLAEVNNYTANYDRMAIGVVLESSLEKGFGPTASIIVKNGILRKRDFVLAGHTYGNIKMILDENNKQLEEVLPSQPAKIIGLEEVSHSGEIFFSSNDQKTNKELIEIAQLNKIKNKEYIPFKQEEDNPEINKVNLIIKANEYGVAEAIKNLLTKINIEGSKLKIVRCAVGGINETDIDLAKVSNSKIIGFVVKPQKAVHDLADSSKIQILYFDIIYKLQEYVTELLTGSTKKIAVEKETGEAIIQQLWFHSNVGTIAGCKCTTGEINRNDSARILRNGIVIHSTKINSMKHEKNEISKISNGMEFGITLKEFNDLKVGDVIQSYKVVNE